MEKSIKQVEKDVSASFAYVKKDMLMLNDAFSDLHDKVQHLSLNHATLLEEIGRLRSELSKMTKDTPDTTGCAERRKTKKILTVKKSTRKKK